jgi:hypothetical protein
LNWQKPEGRHKSISHPGEVPRSGSLEGRTPPIQPGTLKYARQSVLGEGEVRQLGASRDR